MTKALIIGINYFGSEQQLRGCINDARHISRFINERYGFFWEDMVILTEDQPNPVAQPTRANIIRGMQWLVKDAQPHDSLFFHYSGHGGQTVDFDFHHLNGYDDTIFPLDWKKAGQIISEVCLYFGASLIRKCICLWYSLYRLVVVLQLSTIAVTLDLPSTFHTNMSFPSPEFTNVGLQRFVT